MAKFLIANVITQVNNILLYPLDTIGKQIMVSQNSLEPKQSKFIASKSINTTLILREKFIQQNNPVLYYKRIMKKDGFKGLYNGFSSESFQGVGTSLVLILYDELKKRSSASLKY